MINSTHGCILGPFYADDETRTSFYNPTYLRTQQKTTTEFNLWLYFGSNTTSQCEFRLKYNLWLNLVLVFSDFNKLSNLLYYKQRQVVVQPMIESGLGFLMCITFWIPHHITTSGCYVWIFSSFNVMVYQVAKHSNVQPMVECCDRIRRKMICAQICLYIANSHKHQKTATTFNLWLYFVANTTSRCEFILKYNLY